MDKAHKVISIVGAVLFVVCVALLHEHAFPQADKFLQVAIEVLGALGLGVTRPLFGGSQPSAPSNVIQFPAKEEVKS